MTSSERRVLLSSLGGMLGRRPDVSRWERESSFEEEWEERTRIMARLVPMGSRVIEFGAGSRKMAHHLDPSCTYVASDVVDRGPGTLVWDLNARPLPDLSPLKVDVAIFGGVLEYLVSLEPIARWLARHVTTCIASSSAPRRARGASTGCESVFGGPGSAGSTPTRRPNWLGFSTRPGSSASKRSSGTPPLGTSRSLSSG